MTVEANKALVRRFYEDVINSKDVDRLDEILAADFVEHEPFPGLPSTGSEAAKAVFSMIAAASSDFRMTPEDMIGEGDKVVARVRMTGTHTGEFMGIPATRRPFSIQLIDILEIRGDRVAAHWGVTDLAGLMQQLGAAPGP